MAAGASRQQIARALKRLQTKNPDVAYVVLRASNGEVAIMTKAHVDACKGTK